MEQTEKVEGVHKANGTNGKRSGGCILYQTRALLHKDITFYKKESYVFFTKKYANMSMRQSEFV